MVTHIASSHLPLAAARNPSELPSSKPSNVTGRRTSTPPSHGKLNEPAELLPEDAVQLVQRGPNLGERVR